MQGKTLAAALAATTFLTAGIAVAADQAATPPTQSQSPAQAAAMKDAGKLSADGSRAYLDIALTRLAIFDGRIDDAKKFVAEADADFGKAKGDESVFTKAEADLHAPDQAKGAKAADKADDASNAKAASSEQTPAEAEAARARMNAIKQENSAKVYAGGKGDDAASRGQTPGSDNADMATPKRWLPVDAEMSVNEDFSANPQKAAAVADANKKLAGGDKQGAMTSLKLAGVDIDYTMAVVPLDQTLADVHKAAGLVDGAKFYEASQVLRQVQDSTRYDLLDVSTEPGKPAATNAKSAATTGNPAPATH